MDEEDTRRRRVFTVGLGRLTSLGLGSPELEEDRV